MDARSATYNMAADDALLSLQAARPFPTLRLYEWKAPALTFGYFQDIEQEIVRESCEAHGFQLARRPTGGGVVVHDGALTYSVIAPEGTPEIPVSTLDSYRLFSDTLAEGFRSLGVWAERVEKCPTCDPALPDWCALRPTQHDLLADGRKVAGAAQRRTRDGMLHQGYVFLQRPESAILQMARSGDLSGSVKRSCRCLSEAAGHPLTWREVAEAIAEGFRRTLGIEWVIEPLIEREQAAILERERAVFGRDEWNFGDRRARRQLRLEDTVSNRESDGASDFTVGSLL